MLNDNINTYKIPKQVAEAEGFRHPPAMRKDGPCASKEREEEGSIHLTPTPLQITGEGEIR